MWLTGNGTGDGTEHLSRPAAVVVFDAETGAYKGHWGAYGKKPDDKAPNSRRSTGQPSQQFNTPHGVAISNDAIVYVADRANNRIQTFTIDGMFLEEGFVKHSSTSPTAPTNESPSSIA